MPYSQGGEEEVVLQHFGDRTGRLLDIGAYDGVTYSNTRALMERGWEGVFFEPAPSALAALRSLYLDNPKVTIWGGAITWRLEGNSIPFYDTTASEGDARLISSTRLENFEGWTGIKKHEIQVPHRNINDGSLWVDYPGPFHLINIDAEGESADIFLRVPFDNLETEMVICEHDERIVELSNKARDEFGMQPRYLDGNNIIFAR